MDNRVCVVVHSLNRPLHLQCFLESLSNCLPADAPPIDLLVIHNGCKTLYEQVLRESSRRFGRAQLKTESTFYKDFVGTLSNPYYRYIMLCRDDTIFVNDIPLAEGLKVLADLPEVVAYSLRLSPNTTSCYMYKGREMEPPEFNSVSKNSSTYRYKDAKQPGMDYEYWCDTSSTIYRQSDLVHIVSRLDNFHNPTTFEARMNEWRDHGQDGPAFQQKRPLLACSSTKSFAFSNPVNVVEDTSYRAVRSYSTEFMIQSYRNGKRIDIQPFLDLDPNAVHMERPLRFKSF